MSNRCPSIWSPGHPDVDSERCTFDVGHLGAHAAVDGDGRVIASWPDGDEPEWPAQCYAVSKPVEPGGVVYRCTENDGHLGDHRHIDANSHLQWPSDETKLAEEVPLEGIVTVERGTQVNIYIAPDGSVSVTVTTGP